ncbi:MAG: hypothetical protein QXW79_01160 [Thermoplasmata archaeon]
MSFDFINYVLQFFPKHFEGKVLKCLLDHPIDNIPSNEEYDVIITNKTNVLILMSKLKDSGLMIIIHKNEDSAKDITSNNEFRSRFKYRKFYYNAEIQELYGLCLKDMPNNLPDYKADFKISFKETRKTVVIYAFNTISESVKFFIKHGIFKHPLINFVIVCNGDHKLKVPSYVTYLNRENVGYDFGAWSHAIHKLNLKEKYDFFVCINSSVRGPFIPPWSPIKNWVWIFTRLIDYQTKLVGTSVEISQYKPHIQSMLIAFDKIGLELGLRAGIFEKNPTPKSKNEIIIEKEIVFSHIIMLNGYRIRPIISAYYNSEIPIKTKNSFTTHLRNNRYYGTNVHPYEVIFIKDKWGLNDNKDIYVYTDIHNRNFNRFSDLSKSIIPQDFDWKKYLELNKDLRKSCYDEKTTIEHWLKHGYYELRPYKDGTIPPDFDWRKYLELNNDLKEIYSTEEEAVNHWIKYGHMESRYYKGYPLPPDFDWKEYLELNEDIAQTYKDEKSAIEHWTKYGFNEGRQYKGIPPPPDFDWKKYLELNKDIDQKYRSEEGAIKHWKIYGFYENRKYK